MKELSSQTQEVLDVCSTLIKEFGRTPTVREIRDRCELKSLSSIHQHLRKLEARGLIVYLDEHHRHFRIVEETGQHEDNPS